MFIRMTVTFAVMLAAISPAQAVPSSGGENVIGLRIEDLQYLESTSSSRLVIRANLPFTYKAYSEDRSTLVIETEKADTANIAPGITIGSQSIENIKVATRLGENAEEVTAISIRHRPEYSYTITPKGRRLFVEFFGPAEGRTEETAAKQEEREEAVSSSGESENGKAVETKRTAEAAGDADREAQTATAKPASVDPAETDAALSYRMNPVVKYGMVDVAVRTNGNDSAVILSFDRPVERRFYRIVPVGDPPRFVIDFHGARNLLARKNENTGSAYFSSIRSAQFAVEPYPISRVVLDLKAKGAPALVERGNDLVLLFGEAAEQPLPDQPQATAAAQIEGQANQVEDDVEQAEPGGGVKAADVEETQAEQETATAETEAAETEETSPTPIDTGVENEEPVEAPLNEAEAETSEPTQIAETSLEEQHAVLEPEEKQNKSEETASVAAVVEEEVSEPAEAVAEKEPPKLETGNNGHAKAEEPLINPKAADTSIRTKEVPAKAEPTPSSAGTKVAESSVSETPKREPISENISLFSEQYPDGLKPSEEPGSTKTAAASAARPAGFRFQEQTSDQQEITNPQRQPATISDFFQTREITSAEQRYFGKKVSVEFENINLRALILLLGQMTDKNFILDPSVQPISVAISLRDLPWDQALDIILDNYGLGKIEEGNVIRIASRARLTQEAEERRRLVEQQALAVPMRQIAKPINYAKAEALAQLLRRNLSTKGEVVVDARTNTLVITDIPSKVEEHLKLIDALDIPTKQVIVEARIVETTRDFINEFGLQYGFRGSATSEYGSSTGVVFPNQMTISGGSADVTTKGLVPFAVNLPANTVNTSLLGSFGNINGSFVLDAILTAAESEKKVRVLSRPRISAQNNARAEIKSGVEVPFQVVQNNTVGIRWREATLKLEVTPHITSDSTVILDLQVDKSSLGVATAAGFTIQKRAATSTVLVKDGGVAVIGGVLEISNNLTEERTPFLSKLPIIGRLFRNKLERVQNTELLIFISPKIIN
jgi:type IV pilus secretin PilQ/predicted competence protein